MNYSFDKKDIFSVLNCEEAEDFIGKTGFFGNSLSNLEEKITKQQAQILSQIFKAKVEDKPFVYVDETKDNCHYALFLPEEKVTKPETHWRAFKSFAEFSKVVGVGVGSVITWKSKDSDKTNIFTSLIEEVVFYEGFDGHTSTLTLGGCGFWLDQLFKEYEYKNAEGNWQPFGIEE